MCGRLLFKYLSNIFFGFLRIFASAMLQRLKGMDEQKSLCLSCLSAVLTSQLPGGSRNKVLWTTTCHLTLKTTHPKYGDKTLGHKSLLVLYLDVYTCKIKYYMSLQPRMTSNGLQTENLAICCYILVG